MNFYGYNKRFLFPVQFPFKAHILSMLETHDGKLTHVGYRFLTTTYFSLMFSHLLENYEFRSSYSCLYEISFTSF